MPTIRRQLHTQVIEAPLNFPIEHGTLKTFVEYALILALVIVLVIVALNVLGPVPQAITDLSQSYG